MDKRSWWKKKSSDKQAAAADIGVAQTEKDIDKEPTHIQILIETHKHLTGLEDQVKSYEEKTLALEDEVVKLNEKLSKAHLEIKNKENIVKDHAKVAEEAIAGWEKAEAETAEVKNNLESVTLLKLTAEDRGSHLDGALKECMRQIRNLKEEHEKNMHDLTIHKSKLFDEMKHELESRIGNLDQELMMSAAENDALSRSLHERSNMLINLREEKSQADAEIERLKSNIESCEKEISSLKYELHVSWKDAEIRNEETNMSVRSAEVANKQYLEAVKKIAKLEAESQRLRGLVRKKLPGPAAIAQMRIEVDRDYGDSRFSRSQMTPPSPYISQKENEILTERLLATEEETKMLKEALTMRTTELQTSRSLFAQAASKIQSLEAQVQANEEQRSPWKSSPGVQVQGLCYPKASPQSVTSMSEGNYDSPHKSDSTHQKDLMDDFLEMEKLAYQSDSPNSTLSNNSGTGSKLAKTDESGEVIASADSVTDEPSDNVHEKTSNELSYRLILSKISTALESISTEDNMEKVIVDIRCIMQEMHDTLHDGSDLQTLAESRHIVNGNSDVAVGETISEELKDAVSQIYGFIVMLSEEIMHVPTVSPREDGISSKLEILSTKYIEAKNSEINVTDFVIDVSHVLSEASDLHFNVLGPKRSGLEHASSDCIDKIALQENNGCTHFYDSASSDLDVPNHGDPIPISESRVNSWKCSLEEFEQLKMEKNDLAVDLAKCTEKFESTQAQLLDTEKLLAEVKSQLLSAQKSNSLSETQLKCMAESYESLETRAEKLQDEVNFLQGKIDSLDNELQEEKQKYQGVLLRCNDLQEQLERFETGSAADNCDDKSSQEKEMSDAAEKLAQCQETIFLLGKQLKAMRPQTESPASPNYGNLKIDTNLVSLLNNEEPKKIISSTKLQDNVDDSSSEMDIGGSFYSHRAGSESPLTLFNVAYSPSDVNNIPKSPKHRNSMSGSSTPTPEKHVRGISRFFSSKGKHGH